MSMTRQNKSMCKLNFVQGPTGATFSLVPVLMV